MAESAPNVAVAYILIRARDDGARADIRRIGEQYGEEAGKAAAVSMGAALAKNLPAEMAKHKAAFQKAGQDVGKVFGEAAGSQAAQSMGERLRDSFTRIDVTATDLGRGFGRQFGEIAGRQSGLALESGMGRALSSGALRALGSRVGSQFGDVFGESAGRSLVDGMRRQIEAGAARITVTVQDLPRLAIGAGQAGEAAGQRFSDTFKAHVRDAMRSDDSGGAFTAYGRGGADYFMYGFRERMARARGGFGAAQSAFRDVYQMYATYGRGAAGNFASAFKANVVGGLSSIWNDPRVFQARVFARSGVYAGQRFGAGFASGLGATSRGASKILENGIYKGINSGISKALTGVGGQGDGGVLKRLFSVLGIGAGAALLAPIGPAMAGAAAAAVDLSGALGLLPGALVAVGAGVGTVRLGLLGVGEAIEASSGEAEEYDEALKGLSSSARKFVKAVVDQKGAAKQLQQSVQQRLFLNLGKDVSALSDRYLPILQRKLTGIAGVFNDTTRVVAKFLDSGDRSTQLEKILTNSTRGMRNLLQSTRPVTAALLDIAQVGSSFLPDLADDASESITNFARKIQKAKDDGSLKQYFQEGIDAVGDFKDVLVNAGSIISGVFAAGGQASASPLETLATSLGKVAAVVNTPGFQAGLSSLFSAIATGADSVFAAMPRVADALVELEPTISALVRGSGAALGSTLETIAEAAIVAAPTLEAVAGAFEAVAPSLGPAIALLIGAKVALVALSKVEAGLAFLTALPGRFSKLGDDAGKATKKVGGLSGALGALGRAGGVLGAVLVGQQIFGAFADDADVTRDQVTGLTEDLKKFGQGVDVGNVGILGENFSDLGKQLREASDPSIAKQFVDMQGKVGSALTKLFTAGKSDGSGKSGFFSFDTGVSGEGGKQATELAKSLQETDKVLADMVTSGNGDQAAQLFNRLNTEAIKGGRGVGELAGELPRFSEAVAASGGALDSTSGKVGGLARSLGELARETTEYASAALGAMGSQREYEAAIDGASEAFKRNGESAKKSREELKIGNDQQRENAASLDALAAAGIAMAQQTAGEGVGSQERFRKALQRTREDLITAARRFGLSKSAAEAYADSVLDIPSKAETRVSTPGLTDAAKRAKDFRDRLMEIPNRKSVQVQGEFFWKPGRGPGSYGNGLGVLLPQEPKKPKDGGLIGERALRRNYGGMINPRLGAPRQDNVPLLVSGGEFVMNAWAMKAPGVESLMRYINGANRLPDSIRKVTGYASGGKVAAMGSAGMFDLSNAQPQRIQRTVIAQVAPQAMASGGGDPERLERLIGAVERLANRPMYVQLNDGAIAGAVVRGGGYS